MLRRTRLYEIASRPSVRPSVRNVYRYRDHIGWNTSKIISPPNSYKIVMLRFFLRNRRLILRLRYFISGHSYIGRIARWSLR